MNPQTLVALSALVAVGGHFARNPGDTAGAVKVTVGVAAYAFGLLIFANINDQLALAFAWLVFIALLFYYGPALAKKLAFLQAAKGK